MSSNNDFISLDTLARTQSTRAAAVLEVMMSGLVTPQAGQTVRQPGTNRLNRNLLRYKPRPQPAPIGCWSQFCRFPPTVSPSTLTLNGRRRTWVPGAVAEVLQNLKKTDRPRTVYPVQPPLFLALLFTYLLFLLFLHSTMNGWLSL